jgi:hypothetical protein
MSEVTMVKITDRDLYKAVKNYLHNELHLSEQIDRVYIDKLIVKAIEEYVRQLFADKGTIERIIENKISELIRKGTIDGFYQQRSFGDVVLGEIKRAVRDQVMSKLDVSVSLGGIDLLTNTKESNNEHRKSSGVFAETY